MASASICTFWVDTLLCGIELRHLREIMPSQEMTKVPLAPPSVLGVLNVRGSIVTAIDLRLQLGLPPRADAGTSTHLIVTRGSGVVSLMVDEIGDVVDASTDAADPVPSTLDPAMRRFIERIHPTPEGLVLQLDVARATAVSP